MFIYTRCNDYNCESSLNCDWVCQDGVESLGIDYGRLDGIQSLGIDCGCLPGAEYSQLIVHVLVFAIPGLSIGLWLPAISFNLDPILNW